MKRRNKTLQINILAIVRIIALLALLFFLSCKRAETGSEDKRFVVLSPEIAEIIAAIEGTENVVGITEECTYPDSYANKEVVGKFGTIDKEKIIALKPSIVFTSALEQQSVADELSRLGIRVVSVYPQTVMQMLSWMLEIGKIIGKEQKAAFVADSLSKELDEIRKNGNTATRPKVYLEIYRQPLMSVSDKSFVGDTIELAGGDNIFSELERDYSRISSEDVIRANPDIIICFSQDTKESISKRMGWKDISAVRNDRIYFEKDINPDWLLRAGPRCVLGARRLQEIMDGMAK